MWEDVVVLTEILGRLWIQNTELLCLLLELCHPVIRYVQVFFHWRQQQEVQCKYAIHHKPMQGLTQTQKTEQLARLGALRKPFTSCILLVFW